jgi:hypothetical protein
VVQDSCCCLWSEAWSYFRALILSLQAGSEVLHMTVAGLRRRAVDVAGARIRADCSGCW